MCRFTHSECQGILNIILKYNLSQYVMGNHLWELLIKLKLFEKLGPPRTYSTLQTMFRKKIVPDLEKAKGRGLYRCSPEDFKKYEAGRRAAKRSPNCNMISEHELRKRITKAQRAAKQ